MLIFLIGGCIFFSLGLMIIIGFIRFRLVGVRVQGRVRAIEEYVSFDSEDRSETTMYRPIVAYIFRGEQRIVTGISSNHVLQKPKQDVSVLVIEEIESGEITARIAGKGYILFGLFFCLLGLIAISVFAMGDGGSVNLTVIGLIIAVLAGLIVPKIIRPIMTSEEDNQTIADDAVLITTMAEYRKVVTKDKTLSYIVTLFFLLMGLGFLYWAYSIMTSSSFTSEELQSTFSSIDGFKQRISVERLPQKWVRLFAIGGIGIYLSIVSAFTLIYQNRKYKNL